MKEYAPDENDFDKYRVNLERKIFDVPYYYNKKKEICAEKLLEIEVMPNSIIQLQLGSRLMNESFEKKDIEMDIDEFREFIKNCENALEIAHKLKAMG